MNTIFTILLLSGVLTGTAPADHATAAPADPTTPAPTFSGAFEAAAVKAVCDTAVSWQMLNFDRTDKKAKLNWTCGALYIGMFKYAEKTGNKAVFKFLENIGNSVDWGLKIEKIYHADNICVGQAFLKMSQRFRKTRWAINTTERAYYIANHPSTAPLDKSHKLGKDERWSWCDALFMAPPVYAELYRMTGEECYLRFLDSEYKECTDSLYDREEHLFYRDIIRIPHREPNGAKEFWARGNGWVFGGLPLVMENLPEGHPSRAFYENLFREMARSIVACQGGDGSWRASLLAADCYPSPENSSSTFFCYGLAWGINHGLLDAGEYAAPLKKGWAAICRYVHPDGMLGYVQPIGAAPAKGVSYDSTQVYGVGSLLLAGQEILRMLEANN